MPDQRDCRRLLSRQFTKHTHAPLRGFHALSRLKVPLGVHPLVCVHIPAGGSSCAQLYS